MAAAIVVALVDQFFFGRDLPTFRAVNFFSYFTVLSNIFAAVLLGLDYLVDPPPVRPTIGDNATWLIFPPRGWSTATSPGAANPVRGGLDRPSRSEPAELPRPMLARLGVEAVDPDDPLLC